MDALTPVAESRPSEESPDGKCTSRIDVPVPDKLFDDVGALATLAGMSRASWVRSLIEIAVHGQLEYAKRRLHRGS